MEMISDRLVFIWSGSLDLLLKQSQITQWNLENGELISLTLPYSLQKYGCQVFRDSKLFCTINQVIITLPPSSEKIYANIFTITYYKYPLSEGKN